MTAMVEVLIWLVLSLRCGAAAVDLLYRTPDVCVVVIIDDWHCFSCRSGGGFKSVKKLRDDWTHVPNLSTTRMWGQD